MEQVNEGNKDIFIDYLEQEPEFNVYVISNLDNYGFSDKNVKFFFDYQNGIRVVLMKYYGSFVLYSKDNDFNSIGILDQILALSEIRTELGCITGKMSSLLRLVKNCSVYCRCTYIMELQVQHLVKRTIDVRVQRLGDADVEAILSLYCNVPEMNTKYARFSDAEVEDIRCSMVTGRIYGLICNNRVISSIATTAENREHAMLINVCTLPKYRGRGYCKNILWTLCNDLFEEGKKKVFIYYENPVAGDIYRELGFQYKGDYGRIGLKELFEGVEGYEEMSYM